MASNIFTVIMAGGVGSRFWPSSRVALPKQFIDILGTGSSLMQMTWERARKFSPKENILVLTNELYKGLVGTHLPELPVENILTEPSRNNTAPCIAYAAYKLYSKDPDALMIVLPSDHLILKEEVYDQKVQTAIRFLQNKDALLTLGIRPTRPDTGYGYIQFSKDGEEVKKVSSFAEKPDAATAKEYIASGNFLWNAGIFIWKAKTVIAAFEKYAPALSAVFEKGIPHFNSATEQSFIEAYYPQTPNISIDYAIMEKAENVYTIPADIGWSDLGTWASLWNIKEKDKDQNVRLSTENMLLTNTEGCIVSKSRDKLAVIDGLRDYIIVDEKDVLLIYPKSKEQEIKAVIKQLDEDKANKYL